MVEKLFGCNYRLILGNYPPQVKVGFVGRYKKVENELNQNFFFNKNHNGSWKTDSFVLFDKSQKWPNNIQCKPFNVITLEQALTDNINPKIIKTNSMKSYISYCIKQYFGFVVMIT